MKQSKIILVVDDDFVVRESVRALLTKNYDIIEADNYKQAISLFNKYDISLAIVDLDLQEEKTGVDLLKELKKQDATLPVIILTNTTEPDTIVKCIKLGAYDYITKPNLANYDELMIKIFSCFRKEAQGNIVQEFSRVLNEEYPLIFNSRVMKQIMDDVVTANGMNILIEGETGVGKTPIAKYANTCAADKDGSIRPFVRINCAGLSRERLQADLFGHKRGSYTGALSDNKGLVELAKGGDLFLDEIAEMDMQCQAELLTFLDSGEYRRLGDPLVRRSNCRIISASNSCLKDKVEQGLFRKDLYSRLSQYKIKIPSLRDRKEDIKPIMEYYINQFCGEQKPYSKEVLDIHMKHDWMEGNVRELRDAVRYMCTKAREDKEITTAHINGDYYYNNKNISDFVIDKQNMKQTVLDVGYDTYIDNIEKLILADLINDEKSIRSLSKKIGVTNMTLGRKLKKYNLCLD